MPIEARMMFHETHAKSKGESAYAKHKCMAAKIILADEDWDWEMIEEGVYEDKYDAYAREQELITEWANNPNGIVNKCRKYTAPKDRCKRLQTATREVVCDCGAHVTARNLWRHRQSAKHLFLLHRQGRVKILPPLSPSPVVLPVTPPLT